MFSFDMPRPLISLVFILATLTGCTAMPSIPVTRNSTPEAILYPTVPQWLDLQQDVAAMSTEEAVEKLVRVNKPEGPGQLFYYGLLNQQLETYGAWVLARDTFQLLHDDEELAAEQRQLAGILQDYNQNRINWYKRQSELLVQNAELKQALHQSEQEKLLLEQKIQALTDLEAVISTRKEE